MARASGMQSGSVAGHRQRLSQDDVLSGQTIRPDIAYSHSKATDKIVNAVTAAHLHESVVLLPEVDGMVAPEPGVSLSGGQQRITTAMLLIAEGGRIIEAGTRNDLMTRASNHRTFLNGQFPSGPILTTDGPAAVPVEIVQCDGAFAR